MAKQYWAKIVTRTLAPAEGIEEKHLQKLNNYQTYGMVLTNEEIAKMQPQPMPLPYEKEVEAGNTTVFVHNNTITYATFICCEDEIEEGKEY